MQPVGRGEIFINKIQELTKLPGLAEQVKMKDGRMLYFASEKMMDLAPDYECDFDLKEENQLPQRQWASLFAI